MGRGFRVLSFKVPGLGFRSSDFGLRGEGFGLGIKGIYHLSNGCP